MQWTDGFGNEPYDPDMTVGEALDLGLIAVMDTGVIGRTYHEPCRYGAPQRQQGFVCTRAEGHKGPHAYIQRWEESWEDREAKERRVKDLERAREAEKREQMRVQAELNRARVEAQKAVTQNIGAEMKKVSDAMQKALDRKIDREFSMVPRNFRDQTAGKIRGPRR